MCGKLLRLGVMTQSCSLAEYCVGKLLYYLTSSFSLEVNDENVRLLNAKLRLWRSLLLHMGPLLTALSDDMCDRIVLWVSMLHGQGVAPPASSQSPRRFCFPRSTSLRPPSSATAAPGWERGTAFVPFPWYLHFMVQVEEDAASFASTGISLHSFTPQLQRFHTRCVAAMVGQRSLRLRAARLAASGEEEEEEEEEERKEGKQGGVHASPETAWPGWPTTGASDAASPYVEGMQCRDDVDLSKRTASAHHWFALWLHSMDLSDQFLSLLDVTVRIILPTGSAMALMFQSPFFLFPPSFVLLPCSSFSPVRRSLLPCVPFSFAFPVLVYILLPPGCPLIPLHLSPFSSWHCGHCRVFCACAAVPLHRQQEGWRRRLPSSRHRLPCPTAP